MKKLLLVIALLVCVVALIACTARAQARTDTSQNTATTETPQTVATVELRGNPTTGYTWICAIAPDGVVKELSNEYVQDDNPQDADGVGGTFIFTFESIVEGEAEITFSYLREWEDNPASTVTVYRAVVDADGNLKLEQIKTQ